MKRIMLGTSETWSTSHLSQQPSKPVYYIVDCRIFEGCFYTRYFFFFSKSQLYLHENKNVPSTRIFLIVVLGAV